MERFIKYFNYLDAASNYYVKSSSEREEEPFTVALPESGWMIWNDDSFWTTYMPIDIQMDTQGWKIHISTVYANAQDTLDIVSRILIQNCISFKHVKNWKMLMGMYSKSGNRISAGKFITIYPPKECFAPLLNELHELLINTPKGPYIITDKQWKNGNVYYRYGAFKKVTNDQGVYCIYNEHGELIPDERKPQYYLPPFVEVPKELLDDESTIYIEQKESNDNRLKLYNIEAVLRYSNSGGIYLAKRLSDDKLCVIKEARAAIGLDAHMKSASQRLQNEYEMLIKLVDTKGIVKVLDYFKVWENFFLVEEFIEGTPLFGWVSINYPFSSNVRTDEYFNKLRQIMTNLKQALYEMHKNGVAMCDLQTQNVLVLENLEVKLIDFEVATAINNEDGSAMFTKGFYSELNTKAGDKDWYALNRIFQFCVLPISPVYDFDMNVNTKQCIWVYENFGEDAYTFFIDFQLECAQNLDNADKIFKGTYESAQILLSNDTKPLSLTLDEICIKLTNGLSSNCLDDLDSFINGDVRQFELDCGMLNIQNGGFGAVLALNRLSNLDESVKIAMGNWIKRTLPTLFSNEFNNGFLVGRAGIACVLYECGYQAEGCKLLDSVVANYSKNLNDFTFRSGLAGIGIALLALHRKEGRIDYLEEAENIANLLSRRLTDEQVLFGTDWDSLPIGLLDGHSGISIFYSLLFNATRNVIYFERAKAMLQKDIDNSKITENDGVLQTQDIAKNRLLPYLSSGSIGVGIAITVFNNISRNSFFKDEISAIKRVTSYRCCIEPGLYDGIAGFFLTNCFEKGNDTSKCLEVLRLFLVEEGNCAFIPGKLFYKYSSDVHTGITGILLALAASKKQNVLYWLPVVHEFL